jgi:MFS family permease
VSWLAACRALDRRVWVLAVARLVVTAGYSMVMPFLAMHLAVERQVPWVTVGLIWFVAGGCGAVAQWLAGELADRLGRRPLMLAAMFARALNLAAMGFAVAADRSGLGSVLAIAVLTVMNAVLRGFFDPVAAAMVADLAPPELRVAAYSLQRVGINLGWAAGPAVATLAGNVPYATLFYASAPLTLVSAVAVAAIGESQASGERRGFTLAELLAFARDRILLRFLAATFAFFVLQVQLYQTASIYAASVLKLDRAQVGTMFTLNGALVVLLQLPAIQYIQRLGTRRALIAGTLGYAVSYAAVGLAVGQLTLLACIAAVTLAEIITSPAQQAAVTGLAPPGRTGAYTGLYGLCQVAGQSSGPLIGTTLLSSLPPRAAWFGLGLFGVIACLGYRSKRVGTKAALPPESHRGRPGTL